MILQEIGYENEEEMKELQRSMETVTIRTNRRSRWNHMNGHDTRLSTIYKQPKFQRIPHFSSHLPSIFFLFSLAYFGPFIFFKENKFKSIPYKLVKSNKNHSKPGVINVRSVFNCTIQGILSFLIEYKIDNPKQLRNTIQVK